MSTQFNCQKHFYFKLFSLVKAYPSTEVQSVYSTAPADWARDKLNGIIYLLLQRILKLWLSEFLKVVTEFKNQYLLFLYPESWSIQKNFKLLLEVKSKRWLWTWYFVVHLIALPFSMICTKYHSREQMELEL